MERTPSPRPASAAARARERGFMLLLVLLLTPIAIVVVSELSLMSNLELIAAQNVTDIAKIEYAIDGQFEITLARLKLDRKQSETVDGEYDEWNSSELRQRTDDDVALNERVFDEAGKLNLMRLVTGNEQQQARAKKMLVDVLDMFREGVSAEREKGGDLDQGTAEDVADKIVKYMKREGAVGQVPKPKTTPPNSLLLLDEIMFADDHKLIPSLLVDLKVKDKTAPGLHRYLTIYGSGKVNVNTAPLVVLKAEFTNLQDRENFPQGIVDRRRSSPDAASSSSSSAGMSGTPSGTGTSTAGPTQGNPFADVGALVDGSVQGLTAEVLQRNAIDPAVEFDVKTEHFGIRIEGATARTQRDELYVVQRVKTDGFRFLLHEERIDRLLASTDDAPAAGTTP